MPFNSAGNEDSDLWRDLVVAVLAVNQYSLERTYFNSQGLVTECLADPVSLSKWSADEIVERLCKAGYDRGPFMTRLFAERLHALGLALSNQMTSDISGILDSGDRIAIEKVLMPIRGVGPRVLANFFLLRGC
ncbi:MAG: hypothetical protein LC114_17780 [Bryobacterales bacterium]|nr:hypothetical protein [Bryobacterales bacterium]